jgi:YegS/Rv2252/BmrU family lipid kinase
MRYLFLLNPTAGKQDSSIQLTPALEAALKRAGIPPQQYQIVTTKFAGHARELASAAARSGEEVRIYAAGGDGTLNEVLRGAYGYSNISVGCLPYGSGNDFLRTFGTREEFLDLDAQLVGDAVEIDMIETTRGLSASICAAGLDAQVAYGIPTFRRLPFCGGEMAYLLSIVQQLCGHLGRKIEYNIDGEIMQVDCLMCAICNGRHYGGGFEAAPEAQPDDGLLDVFIIRKVGRLTIARLLGIYKNGKHFKNGTLTKEAEPYFIFRRAKRVELHPIDGRGPIIATADGECGPNDSLTAEIHPHAARILLPKPVYERFISTESNEAAVV